MERRQAPPMRQACVDQLRARRQFGRFVDVDEQRLVEKEPLGGRWNGRTPRSRLRAAPPIA